MKAKELKDVLAKLDDETEIAVHIAHHNATAECFLHLVNDVQNGRIILDFIEDDKYIH